jgi:DNA-binding GntR family transcriptional regulator
MKSDSLQMRLASQIVDYIRTEELAPGTRLPERLLAERLRVSRSPIRGALQVLAGMDVVDNLNGAGFVVRKGGHELKSSVLSSPVEADDEKIYFTIAEDRLAGRLPDRISESEMIRRYDLSRTQLANILRRIANEGWAERLPGHGWEFRPMLTSTEAYIQSFRLRILIEPAGILEPTFKLNRPALEQCRLQQQALLDGDIFKVSPAQLFETNSQLHETILACSNNIFFIDALQRLNKLRRLAEYRKIIDRAKVVPRCREHVTIIDLLLEDKRQEASDLMRRHLSVILDEKSDPL